MSSQYSSKDVAAHNDADSGMWIVVDGDVYDVSAFVDEHPGGSKILKRVAGKDASKQFWKYHSEAVLKRFKPKLCIGQLKAEAKL